MKDEALAKLRTARRSSERADNRRDQAILEAHLFGASLREIADAASLSHMTIKRIIQKKEQP